MRCPQCTAILPDTATQCECGRPFGPDELRAVRAVLRRQKGRARRRRAAVLGVVALLAGLVMWLWLR